MPIRRVRTLVTAICLSGLVSLSGCAGTIPAAPKEERSPADPWEPMNRRISNFNRGFDSVTWKPLARGYEAIVPEPMRNGVNNFSRNLLGPLFIINNFLQGKFGRGFSETGRFLANSTWGILGFVNVGDDLGLETYDEDFGQTFATWGIPAGPYVVVPILGPRTLRGAFAIPLNFLSDPLWYVDDSTFKWTVYGIRGVDLRYRLFTAERLIEDSYDRYLAIREALLQRRRFLIFDGDPPEDDDFYDEFEDEFLEEEQQD